MKWLRKLFGRKQEYLGNGFRICIKQVFREVVSIEYTRDEYSLTLGGERIGKRWEGIAVNIPQEVESTKANQIACDLASGFESMKYGYVITRKIAVDIIPQSEIDEAMAELREMGYEIQILPDGKIRQSKLTGSPRTDIETIRKQTPRMMQLIQTLHGKRTRFETLAKSKHFLS